MQAIILAAGMGKRLKDLTKNNTKCMVEVNGVSLIDRMLHQLERKGLSKIVVVVGYEGKKLMKYIDSLQIQTPIVYVNNPIYDKTNNIYSLALAKEYLCREDTLLLESDLIFDDSVIDTLLDDPKDTLALVDKYESWMDGTCVKLGEDDSIAAFVPGKKFVFDESKEYYKTVNLYKFSREFSETYYVPFLDAYSKALGDNEYYEQVLRVLTMLDDPPIKAKRLNGQRWYEIDDIQDLDIASSLFMEDEKRYFVTQSRQGGYWRYPKMIDFIHPANPYFPPAQMMDEMKANLELLLASYPSGDDTSNLLAAKNFSVSKENIVVGGSEEELIQIIIGKHQEKICRFGTDFKAVGCSYHADEVMEYCEKNDIQILILSNPDKISGNYIPKADMRRLLQWAKNKRIRMILDESSVDYVNETEGMFIRSDVLKENRHLFVVKNFSNCYGIPGLRLAVLASGDEETIKMIKRERPIWNINSFAEFYMQIAEKYKEDYENALCRFRKERERFTKKLADIEGIQVISSQSDFVVLEFLNGISSEWMAKQLLKRYNLLVCDLSGKVGIKKRQLLKVAVRGTEDNDKLLEALQSV